ncbi:MAG TPA: glycosyltransferase 87 family protein [Acidimicrobiales bacterium]|nr:glycosyltransferase 87 family protein [Acidimicrobiales bacterium]
MARWRGRRGLLLEAFSVAWLPWLTARVITLFALGLAKYEVKHFHITDAKAVLETHDGLLGSDAGWYQTIAAHGYGALPRSATRFFPLLPLLDRGLHDITALTVGIASLLITNLAALLLGVGIYALVRSEFEDTVLARRAVWLIMLAPPAFVFVMGYSEALLVLLSVAFFITIRRGNWWWAALFGYLAGTARPIGCLLVVPAIIEVIRSWRADRWARWAGKVAAIGSSVAGTITYLGWVSATAGGFLEPLKIQQQQAHHGALTDPVSTIYHSLVQLAHGHHIGDGLHVPWIGVALILLVVAFWRLPASYGAFALVVVVVALSGSNLDSFERYALSAFPLAIAGATLLRSARVATTVYVLSGAAMALYAVLAFQGAYVP